MEQAAPTCLDRSTSYSRRAFAGVFGLGLGLTLTAIVFEAVGLQTVRSGGLFPWRPRKIRVYQESTLFFAQLSGLLLIVNCETNSHGMSPSDLSHMARRQRRQVEETHLRVQQILAEGEVVMAESAEISARVERTIARGKEVLLTDPDYRAEVLAEQQQRLGPLVTN